MLALVRSRRDLFFMLALVILASVTSAQAGQKEKKEQIEIKTSEGSLKVSNGVDASHLGMPIYPGSILMKDNDKGAGLEFNLAMSGKPAIRFAVTKYRSSDPVAKIRDYYKKSLGKDVTKFTEKTTEGGTVFEIKHKLLKKLVQLKQVDGGTEIDLVRLEGIEDNDDKDKKDM